MLTLKDKKWIDDSKNVKKLLAIGLNKFQLMDDSKINNFVGFISDYKKFIVFKIKDLALTSKNRKSKGKDVIEEKIKK